MWRRLLAVCLLARPAAPRRVLVTTWGGSGATYLMTALRARAGAEVETAATAFTRTTRRFFPASTRRAPRKSVPTGGRLHDELAERRRLPEIRARGTRRQQKS